jgi:protoporphyrinogen oxidase
MACKPLRRTHSRPRPIGRRRTRRRTPLEGKRVIVLGGGLPGLSAAHWLTRQGVPCEIIERASEIGGLARTIERNGFRYDFGGYRFFSRSTEIQQLLEELLGGDLTTVSASSRIYFRDRLYEYPLNPKDIVHGMGRQQSSLALWSFTGSRLAGLLRLRGQPQNLEEWLIAEFGETLFRSFFKDYNEKVWGLPCHRLAAELASQRIRGVSLGGALRAAILPGRLAAPAPDYKFLYPRLGIGELTDRFAAAIEKKNTIRRDATVVEVRVRRARVEQIVYRDAGERDIEVEGTDVISCIPLPRLLYVLNPRPPVDVLASARALVFRDLIAVCLELRRDRVTRDSWIYVPDPAFAFARIIEPKNWSEAMAPRDHTSLVAEHYCFEGDEIWKASDQDLVNRTIHDLTERLRLIAKEDVIGGVAIRIKKPYPVYEIGYREHLQRIQKYLKGIVNLQTVGRGGMFKYYNVAHLVESGIRSAENVFGAGHDLSGVATGNGAGSRTFQE